MSVESEPDGSQWVRLPAGSRTVSLGYEVDLLEAPALALAGAPEHELRAQLSSAEPTLYERLIQPTLEWSELPVEVQQFLEREAEAERPPWQRAILVQAFIRLRYRYDREYLGRPKAQRLLSRLPEGRGHHHLQVLHAGADSFSLGRGICFELNTMLVELLRHLYVPSMIATGWVLDQGSVARPDHLFAVALLPTTHGLCWVPLDASVDEQGVQRSTAVERTTRELQRVPDAAGPWAAGLLGSGRGAVKFSVLEDGESKQLLRSRAELRTALTLLLRLQGKALPRRLTALFEEQGSPSNAVLSRELGELREALSGQLGSSALVTPFVQVCSGELRRTNRLSDELRELVRQGWITVKAVQGFEVGAAESEP